VFRRFFLENIFNWLEKRTKFFETSYGSPGGKYSEKKVGATQAEAITDANKETAERLKKAARVLVNSQPVSIFIQIF